MSLMRLAPETVRLRRIARAWAAGECSLDEYRRARREVIDNFSAAPFDGDNTRRRWDEVTLRGAAASAASAGGGSAGLGDAQVLGVDDSASPGHGRWLLLLVMLLTIVGVFTLWSGYAMADPASVPPVSQRDPNPASSPRLPVAEVRMKSGSWEALPGIDPVELDSVIDAKLNEVQQRNSAADHGFTPGELKEVARFLNVLGVHEGGDLSVADARDLSALIRDQKQRRGISVLELEEVAQAVQSRLRQEGYFLAVVYVPSQPVEDGTVELDVLVGRLGDILVEGGESAPVIRHFADLLGQPLTLPVVSDRLYQLNTMPGFQAQASFEPGSSVGDTRLRLNVLEQREWNASVGLDNHGDGATGNERLLLDAAWLNPRGIGDRLDVGLLATVDPGNQTYGFLGYEAPFGDHYRLRGQVGNNDFSWERGTELDGEGRYFDLLARRSLQRDSTRHVELAVGGAFHKLEWDAGVDQSVALVNGALSAQQTWDRVRVAGDALIKLTAGHIGNDRFAGQDENFWALELDLLAWTPVELPLLDGEQKLSLRMQGQLANTHLPAPQRFALSGPYRVRSFDRGDLLVDQGVVMSLDLRIPIRLGEVILFADSGYGDGRSEDAPYWRRATDIGLGWDADVSQHLTSRFSWALPLVAKGSGGLDDDGSRFYWSLEYAY